MCGTHRGVLTIAVNDIWQSYARFVQSQFAEGRPVTVLPELATWYFNGKPIETPTSWFVTLDDSDPSPATNHPPAITPGVCQAGAEQRPGGS